MLGHFLKSFVLKEKSNDISGLMDSEIFEHGYSVQAPSSSAPLGTNPCSSQEPMDELALGAPLLADMSISFADTPVRLTLSGVEIAGAADGESVLVVLGPDPVENSG